MPDNRDGALVPGPKVKARYGVSEQSIWRWTNDPELEFPQPVKINRRNYWRLADLERWERRCARASRRTA
jgi:predicted DNA-binding transcriptional regulator AlpA